MASAKEAASRISAMLAAKQDAVKEPAGANGKTQEAAAPPANPTSASISIAATLGLEEEDGVNGEGREKACVVAVRCADA